MQNTAEDVLTVNTKYFKLLKQRVINVAFDSPQDDSIINNIALE